MPVLILTGSEMGASLGLSVEAATPEVLGRESELQPLPMPLSRIVSVRDAAGFRGW